MTNDLDTLATALYVKIDDALKASPELAPWRPAVEIAPTPRAAGLVTPAVLSAPLGYAFERRWLRRAHRDFRHLFPYPPQQSGYNKRVRMASGLVTHRITRLATDTSLWSDDVWVVDSTPVGRGRSRETVKRSDLAGWAQYGSRASRSRYLWGPRLRLVCALGGLWVPFALTGAKVDERETLCAMLDTAPEVATARPGQTLIGDRHYFGAEFERDLIECDLVLLRPARKGERERAGAYPCKPSRQTIESINQAFKGRLDLERYGGKSPAGVAARVLIRILALTAVIWLNDKTGQPVKRSLIAYDH